MRVGEMSTDSSSCPNSMEGNLVRNDVVPTSISLSARLILD